MADKHIPLFPGKEYHILSRAVGNEKISFEERNCDFILSRYQKHVSPIADTFAYSLLPNHFHFLVRIKEEQLISEYYNRMKKGKVPVPEVLPDFIMERFANWLNSYTKAINKMYHRKGSLFVDYLRRVAIENDEQFKRTVFYIHKNPVHHYCCKKMEQWSWSSYNKMLGAGPTFFLKGEVLGRFGGIEAFRAYHSQPILKI